MTVTILGGSSFSTPALVDWLAQSKDGPPLTLRLAGRSAKHLAAVSRASRILAADAPIQIEEYGFNSWADSLKSADVAIIQFRVGGLLGRDFDERFCLEYGIPVDEGLGPGGLSCALRSWPVVREIAFTILQYAPHCTPILLTSPGSLLTRLIQRELPGLAVYSICELPFTTLKHICLASSAPVEDVTFSYSGVNHLGWFHQVSYLGVDLLKPYIRRQPDSAMYQLMVQYHAVPLKYFQLHLEAAESVGAQGSQVPGDTRAAQLMTIQQAAMETFAAGDRSAISQVLSRRRTPWYSEAIGPLIKQLGTGSGHRVSRRPFFLSLTEPDGRVEEKAYLCQRGGFQKLPCTPPPAPIYNLTDEYVRFEEQAAVCLRTPSLDLLTQALSIHPWLKGRDIASATAKHLWSYFRTTGWEGMQCVN